MFGGIQLLSLFYLIIQMADQNASNITESNLDHLNKKLNIHDKRTSLIGLLKDYIPKG